MNLNTRKFIWGLVQIFWLGFPLVKKGMRTNENYFVAIGIVILIVGFSYIGNSMKKDE